MTNVELLVALGYPQAWCLRALQACNQDIEAAVEYMLTNGEYLEEAVRESERIKFHKQVQETEAEEDNWIAGVSKEFGFSLLHGREEEEEYHPRNSNNEEAWGFRMTITPSYSHEVSKQLANEPQTRARLDALQHAVSAFTHKHDVALVELVCEHCFKEGFDPLVVSPASILQQRAIHALPFTPTQIGLRFIILRNFNRRLVQYLPLIDLSASESKLNKKLRALRGVVFTQVKKQFLERALRSSHTGDAASLQAAKQPMVVLDRTNHAANTSSTKPLNVFGQLFTQLFRRVPLNELRNADRAFYCILAGEHSDDFGGPYRDALNQACDELQSNSTTLFCRCPSNASVFVPNPRANTQGAIEMFEFCGVLMGIAIRTKTPLPLRLPSFVWKRLCGLEVELADLREIDTPVFTLLTQLQQIETREEWNESKLDLHFCLANIEGKVDELVPGGAKIPVTFDSRTAFCNLAKSKRVLECAQQCNAMRRGMGTQVPMHLIESVFTWEELSVLVCGKEEIDLALLRKCTTYGEGVDPQQIEYFWDALQSFSQDERKKYMRFVWGRSTMPTTAAEFERKHKINLMDISRSYRTEHGDEEEEDGYDVDHRDVDTFLPVSHTCFFSIEFPKYTSKEVFAERLLYAITNCTSIDADETTNARRSAEQDRARVGRVNQDEEDFGWD